MALRHQYQQIWTHCLSLAQAWLHVTRFGKALFIVLWVRIILCCVYPEKNLFSPSLDPSLRRNNILPSTWSFLITQNMWWKRENRTLSQGFYFLQKVSLCLHHQECPDPHTHSRSQERNWREHIPLLSLWHASCLNLKRHSQRWMLCLVLNVFRVLAMWFSASFHDNLIINYTGKIKLHNKPGTRSCHLFFLNPYFFMVAQ